MKIFWWQGGLHVEPETPEEGKAMQTLYKAAKRWSIAGEGGRGPKGPGVSSSSPSSEQLSEQVVGN